MRSISLEPVSETRASTARAVGRARLGWGVVVPIGFCLAAVVLAMHPTVLSGLRLIQTDLGDTRLNMYLLEHSYRWVRGEPSHGDFWSPPFFYPAHNTAAYTDLLLGAAPLFWAWRVLGAVPDTAFQLWTA